MPRILLRNLPEETADDNLTEYIDVTTYVPNHNDSIEENIFEENENSEESEIEIFHISDSDHENMGQAPTFQDWQNFATANTVAIAEGLSNLNAVAFKKEIPEFTGELDGGVSINEWFKLADKVAVTANWTDNQKLRFYQDRLTKSAANFNDTIAAALKAPGRYADWKQSLLNVFQDATVKHSNKKQLKHLRQKPSERIRDFRKRIDDMHRIAYGDDVANSNNAEVVSLQNDGKKEVFINGLKPEISAIIWERLQPNATFKQSVVTTTECEQIIDVRRVSEVKTITPSELEKGKAKDTEYDELKALVKQMANMQLSSIGAEETINYIQGSNVKTKKVQFNQTQEQSANQGQQNSSKPTYKNYPSQNSQNNNQSFDQETRQCFFCNRKGHVKKECRKFRTYLRGKEIEDQESQQQN